MPRERTIRGDAQDQGAVPTSRDQEERLIWSLRPLVLEEYVGQTRVVESLNIAIAAAKKRQEPLEHILFHGPPGLGKTTLAHIIAREMGTSGPALEKPADIVGILSNLETGEVLFIDEIHRLSHTVEEYLYSAMEDFQVDFVYGKGAYAKTLPFQLKRFTLIGATTRAGLLTPPLRDRFGMIHHLDFYSPEELTEVVKRSSAILKVQIEPGGAREIARRSRGTPRMANRLLRRVRDYAQVMTQGVITQEVADAALTREGVDEMGLDRLDRLYLSTIAENYSGGPVGIDALAATINEEVQTLVEVVEPFLLKMGFVLRTPGGRKIGEAGLGRLGLREQGKLL
ncbi:MAG: ruvB [Dehalococcoidia bacterium]|nr:ruvB [Dehalococcoidia bacterium]